MSDLEQDEKPTAWKSMDSAPKDGRKILLWVCTRGSIRRGHAEICWRGSHTDWGDTWLRWDGRETVGEGVALLWAPISPPDIPS